jgi:hypothetical protein
MLDLAQSPVEKKARNFESEDSKTSTSSRYLIRIEINLKSVAIICGASLDLIAITQPMRHS